MVKGPDYTANDLRWHHCVRLRELIARYGHVKVGSGCFCRANGVVHFNRWEAENGWGCQWREGLPSSQDIRSVVEYFLCRIPELDVEKIWHGFSDESASVIWMPSSESALQTVFKPGNMTYLFGWSTNAVVELWIRVTQLYMEGN